MFLRCPDELIHCLMVQAESLQPKATFSARAPAGPAALHEAVVVQ